ncbi:MAG: hypothetical protein JOZ17_05225 [Acetobacteraceae bacterium]|nr:hypothetical protein [Acetobacteraceae bacterium]
MSRQERADFRSSFDQRPAAPRLAIFVLLIATALLGVHVDALAQSGPSGPASARSEGAPRKQASENRYTAGFVTGAPYSTEFAMVQEIATVLARGQETGPHGEMALRVLPMVGTGGVRNISDVLTLAGADMAIAPVILANRVRDAGTFGDIRRKLVYIALLHTQEFHLLVRPEVKTVADLQGKTISLGEEGGSADLLGREVLDALGAKIKPVNMDLDTALDGMQRGQLAAALVLSGKPVKPLLGINARLEGFRFLPIPYAQALQRDYLPSSLAHADYPNIIADGESVGTIAIQSALFVYNWPAGSARFELLKSFTETFFLRFSEFLGDDHHPKWREVTLGAQLPGWERFRPAERWLARQTTGQAGVRNATPNGPNAAGASSDQEEKLFREFLRWRERQQAK